MKRVSIAFAFAVALMLIAASGATRADDAPTPTPAPAPTPSPAPAPGPAEPEAAPAPPSPEPYRLKVQAVDFTRTLLQFHGDASSSAAHAAPKVMPLGVAEVAVRVYGPEGEIANVRGMTKEDGALDMELPPLPEGTIIHAQAFRGDGKGGGSYYYAEPFAVTASPPGPELRFLEVTIDSRDVGQRVLQIVTVRDGPDGQKVAQVRHTIQLINRGFRVFVQDFGGDDPYGYAFPVPDGFEIAEYKVDNVPQSASETIRGPHGGRAIPFRQPIYPSLSEQRPSHTFFALLRRPYADGDRYEVGFHSDLQTFDYSLNLESPAFAYEGEADPKSGRVALADAGLNPPMGETQKVTRGYVGQQIPAHATIAGTFRAGKPPVDKKTKWVTAIIITAIVGSLGLGLLLASARRATPASAEAHGAEGGPPTAAARLADLDSRFARREITSVEYEARRRAIAREARAPGGEADGDSAGPVAAGAAGAPGAPRGGRITVDAATRERLRRELDEIAARPAGASGADRDEDVKRLARALREILS